ncbi:trypsin beta-like [Paramacrobiotus metropolitanus]|uniref:trypsin beta-like n=1 Tax=Paramacrobiotus metropolitanus TaxID=2943436 RepID=UPI002445A11F|nr:trypsin beta-like [Paramacrobiotus metropolitanus]
MNGSYRIINVLLFSSLILCHLTLIKSQTVCFDVNRPGVAGFCTDTFICQLLSSTGYVISSSSVECLSSPNPSQVCCMPAGGIPATTPFPLTPSYCSVPQNNSTFPGQGLSGDGGGNIIVKSLERMGRILGGTQVTDPSRHCWIAGIYLNNQLVASGALVSANVVLTTFSPVQRATAQSLTVRLGVPGISGATGTFNSAISLQVAQIVRYQGYRVVNPPGYPVGNLAVLRLSQSVDFSLNPSLCTACLPGQSITTSSFLGDRCHVAGYGSITEGTTTISDGILREVMVPIIPRQMCDFVYQRVLNQFQYATDASSICAGGESGKDTCTRDGGAPLRCTGVSRQYPIVVGLSSWGVGCGRSGIPSVYTDLSNSQIFAFIQQQVSASGSRLFPPPITTAFTASGFVPVSDSGNPFFAK